MMKHYLSTLFLLALALGTFSPVLAQDTSSNKPIEIRDNQRDIPYDGPVGPVMVETRERVNADLKSNYEARRAELEAQREKIRVEAEAKRTAAQARGDEAAARREAMRLELEAKRADMDARREAMRVEAEAKRAEMQARRTEFQREIAMRKAENTARVISATIERLEKIITRIESRIDKVRARGGVTLEAEGYVAAARNNLSDARVSVNAFASIDLSGETAQDNFERVRAIAAEAREHIRAAHQNLMLAVRTLGSVEVSVEVTADAE